MASNGVSPGLMATRRTNYRYYMACKWLQVHRPDIWELIRKESYEKFPLRRIKGQPIELSKMLMKAK